MRISPVAGFVSKRCTENIELTDYKDKKVQIEKETVAFVPIYSIHNDPQYYPNPEIFDPDRFSAENGGLKKFKDMGVYLAFGDGPRICLGKDNANFILNNITYVKIFTGMRFALLQVKAAVVEIVRNNQLSVNKRTHETIVYDPKNFLLVPIGGIWLNFKPI